ncbi:MTH1187 family thiamine-binding protein [Desulfoferrobacter suflitae]|uniref:MTH1187 family thiamine-binding protein n=1 Tax=Desulfoferrobacter suflitae TaxID=2865782 RepID=UPI002164EBAA|nr:MTH1187 family thiamine-binding protein [Desulfoferrobacter suflitae]MCK8602820.1 MTH1187 family thiamine-binding protein [Desulfoferrobacter suflitae]
MAIVEISIVPMGVQGTSVSDYVAKAVAVVQASSLKYELTAMGTIICGDLQEIWDVLKRMHESGFDVGAPRVLTQIRIDDRRDKPGSPEQKIRSVMEKL